MPVIPVHVLTTSSTGGFDTFGWDSLVAIGTLLLAIVTAWLAWSTRKLARETGDDIRAEFRPVLIDGGGGELTVKTFTGPVSGSIERAECAISMRNVGPGPALNAGIELSIWTGRGNWHGGEHLGTVGPGAPASKSIVITSAPPSALPLGGIRCTVECTYRDLSDGQHRTVLSYQSADDIPEDRFILNDLVVALVNSSVKPVRTDRPRWHFWENRM